MPKQYPFFPSNFRRSLCSSQQGQGDVIGVSLAEKLPGLPAAKYAQATSHSYDTHVTTLDNGLRIASENKFGQFCTVGGVYAPSFLLFFLYQLREN